MLTVKKAAELTGLTVKAIRYYEREGLLPAVDRAENGYRQYGKAELERLRLIQFYRSVQIPIPDIACILNSAPAKRQEILSAHLTRISRELSEKMHAQRLISMALDAERAREEHGSQTALRSAVAIIGIDLQNDFTENGALPCKRIWNIIPNLKELYSRARLCGIPIIYISDIHCKDADEELIIWGDHCIEGSWGAEIIDDIKPEPQDYKIKKCFFNGFVRTNLQSVLDTLGVETIIFTGWRSDVCVTQTAIDAFYRGYRVIIVSDGVDSTTRAEHEAGIRLLQINYDFEMYPAATVLQAAVCALHTAPGEGTKPVSET